MLYIFTDPAVKKRKDFFKDANGLMLNVRISNTTYNRSVISDIDQGQFLDENYYLDRYGAKVSVEDLSTSSKILLALPYAVNMVLNGSELGVNCGELLLKNTSGKIYIPSSTLRLMYYDDYDRHLDVSLDGTKLNSYDEFYDYIEENF